MEVLLLQDVAGVGKKNDLLIVGDGFALNCLLPQRKALVATPTVRKRYADAIRRRAEEKEHEKEVQAGLLSALRGKQLTFRRKATKTGKLYASITEKMIAHALKEEFGVEVPADAIDLKEHIKTTGTLQVPVTVGGASETVTVIVEPDADAGKTSKKAA